MSMMRTPALQRRARTKLSAPRVCSGLTLALTLAACAGPDNGDGAPSSSVALTESTPVAPLPSSTGTPSATETQTPPLPSTTGSVEPTSSASIDPTTSVPSASTSSTASIDPTGSTSGSAVGTGGAAAGGTGGSGGAAAGGAAGTGGAAAGGAGGSGGAASLLPEAPENLSETGLYTARGEDGELVLAPGVREFQPRYWLWSDGSDKRRYIYLPPDTQINTDDPDHWVMPVGTKLWKSFISAGQLVETRLIERTGEGANDYLYATYFWMTADATDAIKMKYKNLLLNAAGTTHDIPNGMMCERCHGALKDRALGFSALQLNHDLGGLNLATLLDEGLLTTPVSLDIQMPGDDELTKEALGYLHANCGNCHNDSDGLPLENVPAPQMLLRISVNDQTLEDTDVFKTAINQLSTASSELAVDYRIFGGDVAQSAVHFRMTQRMIEDQMPPIGTELIDDEGLELLRSWIETLPPPEPAPN